MDWRSIQIEGIAEIEREVAVFYVAPRNPDLPMMFRVQIVETQNRGFIGHPEIALKDAAGNPDWTSGRGDTIETALADTVAAFLQTVAGKEPITDESIAWTERF